MNIEKLKVREYLEDYNLRLTIFGFNLYKNMYPRFLTYYTLFLNLVKHSINGYKCVNYPDSTMLILII